MHYTNFTHLVERLRAAGFGEELSEMLKIILKDQPSNFELPYKYCFSKQVLEITVYVKKWKKMDQGLAQMYYLQKYHAALSRENTVDRLEQDFYFGHPNPAVTIQQAYNLLCGRSVYRENLISKEQTTYNAWVNLDFHQTDSKGNFKWQYYGDTYGYDLAAVLRKYPILDISDPEGLHQLVTPLRNGYRELVTMVAGGKEAPYYIEALPRFKSLEVYDGSGNRLTREEHTALIHPAGVQEPSPETDLPKRKRTAIK